MRHRKKGRKLGTDASHTKAMKRSLVCALLANDRIKTIDVRAKEIRPEVDRVITWAKKGDLHSRRLAIALLDDKEIVREIFEKAAQGMWADRAGGYTRIYKLGNRKGDNAPLVIIELVTEPVASAKAASAPVKKTTKKSTVKKTADETEKIVASTDVPEIVVAEEDLAAESVTEEVPVEDGAASEASEDEESVDSAKNAEGKPKAAAE
jgi:large subunit ribosomal protein L17